ncbi:MAG: hypothetical protein E7356_03265 [Clostridiales bacterium]|nr:hypothetical protein [Clostridiales bacterium]
MEQNNNTYSRYIKWANKNAVAYNESSEKGKQTFHDQFLADVKRTVRRVDKAHMKVEDIKARQSLITNPRYRSDWDKVLSLGITTAITAAGLAVGTALDNYLDSGVIATSFGTISSALVGCGIGTKLTSKSFRSKWIQRKLDRAYEEVHDAEKELEAQAMLAEKITGKRVWPEPHEDDFTNN